MAEFQQPEFPVMKTWNSVNERNSGIAKEVETLFLTFRLRLKCGLWYYSYTIVRLALREIVAIIRNVLVLRLPPINQVLGTMLKNADNAI